MIAQSLQAGGWRFAPYCVLGLLLAAARAFAQQPELSVQTGHSADIYSLAYSPDGRLLASGSKDYTIRLWDTATGLELRTLRGHSHWVNAVAFSPDGKLLASASADHTIRLWEVASGKLVQMLSGHDKSVNAVAFLPDGRSLVSGSDDHTIVVWDVATGSARQTLSGHTREVYAISLSADGRTLASGSYDRTLRVWDLASGQTTQVMQQRANALALSPDGRQLASGGYSFKLWDVKSGQERATLEQIQQETPDSHGAPAARLAFSRDGRSLAGVSGDGTIRVWEVATGQVRKPPNCCNRFSSGIAFSPDGTTLAAGGVERIIRLWSMAPGAGMRELRALAGHSDAIHSLAFSPDGRTLLTGRYDSGQHNAVKAWDLMSGAPPRALPGAQISAMSLLFSADGKQLASGGFDNTLLLRDIPGARLLREFETGPLDHLAASADGRLLAGAGRDAMVRLWDATTGRLLRQIAAHPVEIDDVALSPDGNTLATTGHDHLLKLWNVATGQLRQTIQQYADKLCFSPDGRRLAFSDRDYGINLLTLATGAVQRLPGGHSDIVRNLVFSSDGTLLASASRDWSVKIWNVSRGQLQQTLTGHTNDVYGLAFSPDGRLLASGSWDATTRLWDVATGKPVASLLLVDENDWLVITPDGLFDGSPGAWSKILWRFSPQLLDVAPAEIFFNEFFYPGLLTDLYAGKRPQAPRSIQQLDRRQAQLKLSLVNAPASGALTSRRMETRITISEAPAGAQDLRLFRNGALVRVWRGDVLQGKTTVTLDADVALVAGDNRLTAYAFNRDNVKSADATLNLTGSDSLRRTGTTWVLATGVNEYANPQFNLRYAVADADDFSTELRRQTQALNPGGRVEITSLRNQAATKAGILRSLSELAARVQPEDSLMVFFAGHGLAADQRFYLVPHDLGFGGDRQQLDEAAMQSVLAHSVSDRELEKSFEGIDAGRVLLVIDACQSGQALDATERRRGPMNSAGLAQLAYEKGMYVLTAAQSYQAAQELSELQHGLLTYALVEEGMKQGAADDEPRDGAIQLREWFDFAAERVPQLQLQRMRQASQRGIKLAYVAGDEQIADAGQRNVQRPRVFYRREPEAEAFVVARPGL